MNNKKILVFIDWYLPGFRAGGPIRSVANLVSHLSAGLDFFIVTRNTDYMDSTSYSGIKNNEWNKLPDGSSVFYLSPENIRAEVFRKLCSEVKPDIVYLNGMFSSSFTFLPLRIFRNEKKIKIIVSARGMLAPGALAIKPLKKKLFLLFAKGFYKNVIFQATNEAEKKQIEKFFSKNEICIAPNLPVKAVYEIFHRSKDKGTVRLLNIARIAPEKNLLFALQLLKQIKSHVEFDFYGPLYDAEYMKKCRQAMNELPLNIKTTYRNAVSPEQIPALFKSYHFLFLPSLGENFGHIILEAMAAGMPVIISNRTPWKNLSRQKAGWDISLQYPEQFEQVIETCAGMDEQEYSQWSQGAHRFAASFIKDESLVNASRQLFS